MFLNGETPYSIAKILTSEGIPSPSGKEIWRASTVKSILTNEKMKGDALLQKSYTIDFLTKKKKKNEGEIQQYYVENSHPAIVDPAVFDMVQYEMARRKQGENRHSSVGIFASRIKCGTCGAWYGSKVWHSTNKYRKIVYRCNQRFKGEKCNTPNLTEEVIKTAFIKAVNIFIEDKKSVIADFNAIKETLFDTASLEKERAELQKEIMASNKSIQECIRENARVALDQDDYEKRYAALAERYEEVKTRLENVKSQIDGKKSRKRVMEKFLKDLSAQKELLTEFDEKVWTAYVSFVTVGRDGTFVFTFKDGVEITV